MSESPILSVQPALKHYAWGEVDWLPRVLGQAGGQEPCAEAWFGAHSRGSARVELAGAEEALGAFLAHHPRTADATGSLPYMLKLLAVGRPLSVQVHPDAAQARAGFEREERASIALDSPLRNYPDANHKPELVVAIDHFEALCGFRTEDEIRESLTREPEFADLLDSTRGGQVAIPGLLRNWFELAEREREARLLGVLRRRQARAAADAADPEELEDCSALALRVHQSLNGLAPTSALDLAPPDAGLIFVWLLRRQRLCAGQGLFVPAGVPHSYLWGHAVEVMATSDNVLRAGLTRKHVDVEDLLTVMNPAAEARLLEPTGTSRSYQTDVAEFRLLSPAGDQRLAPSAGVRTFLALGNEVARGVAAPARISAQGVEMVLPPGAACIVLPGQHVHLNAGDCTLWCVEVPESRQAQK